MTSHLASLLDGPAYRFSDWPNSAVPSIAPGVYTIWEERSLLYAGMAGRSLTAEHVAELRGRAARPTGLAQRLGSHASGRRSGDQFCVYVADRLVLPTLKPDQIAGIAAGSLSLDRLVRDFIRATLTYRFVEVADGNAARKLEDIVCRGTHAAGPPMLNPRQQVGS
jgi:hypothetical protein